jgi:hypothetical protein
MSPRPLIPRGVNAVPLNYPLVNGAGVSLRGRYVTGAGQPRGDAAARGRGQRRRHERVRLELLTERGRCVWCRCTPLLIFKTWRSR